MAEGGILKGGRLIFTIRRNHPFHCWVNLLPFDAMNLIKAD
jgi:hypothetical protein